MSQYDFGAIVATTKSGTALAADMNAWRTALHSAHKGSSRPSYAIAGTMWINDTTSTANIVNLYDGAGDTVLGIWDPTTDTYTARQSKGPDVVAAAALPLTLRGNSFNVTGNTNITSMAATYIGNKVWLTFTGTPILTHHATNLILPGGANIQVAAGDVGCFEEYGSGTWRCLDWSPAAFSKLVSGTQVATTSGTTKDFTGIPPWVKRITILLNGVSTNGTALPRVQIGDSGGIENTSYLCGYISLTTSTFGQATDSFIFGPSSAAAIRTGSMVLTLMDAATNTWVCSGNICDTASNLHYLTSGRKALSAVLDRVRLTADGVDTLDAGTMQVIWE